MNIQKERLLKVLLAPHVSEKATTATEKRNVYTFEVASNATKSEIKDAVELMFSTKVKNVRVVNVRSKTKMFRGAAGKRQAWKKAYVTLLADQKLEMIGAQ